MSMEETQAIWGDLELEARLKDRFGQTPLAFIHSFGCQQNEADTEKLRGLAEALGFGFCGQPDEADLILFNTCAVRESAQDRVYGWVGSLKNLKRKNPKLLIALFGCMTQIPTTAEKIRTSYPYVDIVAGAGAMHRFPALLKQRLEQGSIVVDTKQTTAMTEGLPVRREQQMKAWLPIMQGCDNFCSYCIVPYVRGREVSREPKLIVREAQDLIRDGCKEITLLGQNVNSYGKGLPKTVDFSDLLRRIDDIDGDWRLRFMTSHPKDCSEKLLDTIASSRHICHHIHLPVQSGSDRILAAMNRKYAVNEYLRLVDYARRRIGDVTFSSDIIVGFPGELREDFEQTFSLVSTVRFNALYMFLYSPRSKTAAAALPDPVSQEEKSAWFRELLVQQQAISGELNRALVGKTLRVLIDSASKTDGRVIGRTEGNVVTEIDAAADLIGTFADVKITEAKNAAILGVLL